MPIIAKNKVILHDTGSFFGVLVFFNTGFIKPPSFFIIFYSYIDMGQSYKLCIKVVLLYETVLICIRLYI